MKKVDGHISLVQKPRLAQVDREEIIISFFFIIGVILTLQFVNLFSRL